MSYPILSDRSDLYDLMYIQDAWNDMQKNGALAVATQLPEVVEAIQLGGL